MFGEEKGNIWQANTKTSSGSVGVMSQGLDQKHNYSVVEINTKLVFYFLIPNTSWALAASHPSSSSRAGVCEAPGGGRVGKGCSVLPKCTSSEQHFLWVCTAPSHTGDTGGIPS